MLAEDIQEPGSRVERETKTNLADDDSSASSSWLTDLALELRSQVVLDLVSVLQAWLCCVFGLEGAKGHVEERIVNAKVRRTKGKDQPRGQISA
jgi:hypothetical protein